MSNKNLDIDWAYIVDLFASEYGWSLKDISSLNFGQIASLMKSIKLRKEKENGDSETVSPEHNIPNNEELILSDFENKLGGKKVVHKDGSVEIIV